jgi:hypothetical protein
MGCQLISLYRHILLDYFPRSRTLGAVITFDSKKQPRLTGPAGSLHVPKDDEVALKLAMLFEGQCTELGPTQAAHKYHYSKARYFQLLHLFQKEGTKALQSKPTGPKSNYRRTDETVRQIIRHRFLDPDASAEVIGQKLRQSGHPLSVRSVERVIADYGLQKKTLRS